MSLEYLSKYLNKGSEKTKKRKRTTTQIVEDDLTGWSNGGLVNGEAEEPVVVKQIVSQHAGFRPAYIKEEPEAQPTVKVESTGLLTKEQLAAQIEARRKAEQLTAGGNDKHVSQKPQETVYRDATGRRIDITLAKQEKAREMKREEERKRKEQESGRGLVQQREREAKRAQLEAVKREGFSRYAGDQEAERALKQKRQWNDPAAEFLSNASEEQSRPIYKGGFAPNRFGIRPGYRWDGVDRGNGFEAKRFKAIAAQSQRRSEYEVWAKEDM